MPKWDEYLTEEYEDNYKKIVPVRQREPRMPREEPPREDTKRNNNKTKNQKN